jgi:hypothetical protein
VQEATAIGTTICKSFFDVVNLVGLGFRNSAGTAVTTGIGNDISSRPAGLFYFAFRATVDPSHADSRISQPPLTVEFLLGLPQTTAGNFTAATASGLAPLINRQLMTQFSTPTTATPTLPTVIGLEELELMTVVDFAALGTTISTGRISDYSPDSFSKFSAEQIQQLVLRATPAPPVSTATDVSPRMQAVLAIAGTGGFTYHGSLDFLDNQATFDAIFPNPMPVTLSSSVTSSCTIDSTSVIKVITSFVDQCKFLVFLPLLRTDYVGIADRNNAKALGQIVKAIKLLKMSSCNPGGTWSNLTPDELFAEYSLLTPMLLTNVSLWGFNLVTQFHDGLSTDIQEMLLDDIKYLPSALTTLITKATQLDAVRHLRVAAVRIHSAIRKQEVLISKSIARRLHNKASTATTIAVPRAETFVSPAEETMGKYMPTVYPTDPATGFVSNKPEGFRGCMLCGMENHVFSGCPRRDEPGAKDTFFKHLLAHKPHLRKLPIRPEEIVPGFVPLATQSFPAPALKKRKPPKKPLLQDDEPQLPVLPPLPPDPFPTAPTPLCNLHSQHGNETNLDLRDSVEDIDSDNAPPSSSILFPFRVAFARFFLPPSPAIARSVLVDCCISVRSLRYRTCIFLLVG